MDEIQTNADSAKRRKNADLFVIALGTCWPCFQLLKRHYIFGKYTIYVQSILLMIFFILMVYSLIILLKTFSKSKHKIWCIFMCLLYIFTGFGAAFIGVDYVKDSINGTETISCNYYTTGRWVTIYDADADDKYSLSLMNLTKAQINYLNQNYKGPDKSKEPRHFTTCYVLPSYQTLKVEYYPNTKIVTRLEFLE